MTNTSLHKDILHTLQSILTALLLIASGLFPVLAQAQTELASVPASVSCSTLATQGLEDIGGKGSHITSAVKSQDGDNCVVDGVLAPSIGFRITLPVNTWTQRYLQIGCGGLCGNIPTMTGAADGCVPLARNGFVQGSTDMGHQGNSADFGRDPQKRIDFAYRAQHLTALVAKKLIRAYYGRAQAYAYFTGCSDGGREALMEAQRFPEDFDGIIAGAAAMSFTTQNGLYHAWQARTNTGADGQAILIASRLPLLHQAVLDQCDALDGQKDGLISEPRLCHFDPASIQCPKDQHDTRACLTAQEVDVIRKLYAGPKDSTSGAQLTIGGPLPGSELNWAGVFVPMSADQPIFSTKIAEEALRDVLFESALPSSFTLASLQFNQATFNRLANTHSLYDATNPDLARFAQAGHKLILWHGLADPHISPLTTIAYHEALNTYLGEASVQSFERLYLLPGVSHCSGGEGPSQIDLLTPMMKWVENKIAPTAVIAQQADLSKPNTFGLPGGGSLPPKEQPANGDGTRPAGPPPGMQGGFSGVQSPVKSRPLYPYPQVAHHTGKGDANQADSQEAGTPLFTGTSPRWVGSDYFSPASYR